MSYEAFYRFWIHFRLLILFIGVFIFILGYGIAYAKVVELDVTLDHELETLQKDHENEKNRESHDRVMNDDDPSERDHQRAVEYVNENYA